MSTLRSLVSGFYARLTKRPRAIYLMRGPDYYPVPGSSVATNILDVEVDRLWQLASATSQCSGANYVEMLRRQEAEHDDAIVAQRTELVRLQSLVRFIP